ncbi:hypothetical protein D9M70_629870 [compost metagenome]
MVVRKQKRELINLVQRCFPLSLGYFAPAILKEELGAHVLVKPIPHFFGKLFGRVIVANACGEALLCSGDEGFD